MSDIIKYNRNKKLSAFELMEVARKTLIKRGANPKKCVIIISEDNPDNPTFDNISYFYDGYSLAEAVLAMEIIKSSIVNNGLNGDE